MSFSFCHLRSGIMALNDCQHNRRRMPFRAKCVQKELNGAPKKKTVDGVLEQANIILQCCKNSSSNPQLFLFVDRNDETKNWKEENRRKQTLRLSFTFFSSAWPPLAIMETPKVGDLCKLRTWVHKSEFVNNRCIREKKKPKNDIVFIKMGKKSLLLIKMGKNFTANALRG